MFEKTAKGKTMVVVAHRLATMQNADVMFLIGDGCVVKTRNQASLLRKRGFYYLMVSCSLDLLVSLVTDFNYLVPITSPQQVKGVVS